MNSLFSGKMSGTERPNGDIGILIRLKEGVGNQSIPMSLNAWKATNGIEVHYKSFTIDNQTYELNFSTARVNTPGEIDRLAIAVQLDGNAYQTPYDVFIDKVNFTRQGTAP